MRRSLVGTLDAKRFLDSVSGVLGIEIFRASGVILSPRLVRQHADQRGAGVTDEIVPVVLHEVTHVWPLAVKGIVRGKDFPGLGCDFLGGRGD